MAKDRTIEILQHNIRYWYERDQEMPEQDQEHVQDMIMEGYSSGQLVYTIEGLENNTGWWEIDN